MRIGFFIALFFLFFTPASLRAQVTADAQQSRILILLDGSSSMLDKWSEDKDRFRAAGEIILRLMDSIYKVNRDVEFSLRVYGHQHTVPENDCQDTKNEVEFSKNNYTQMQFRLGSLQPLGVTPIAYSLQQAAENDLVDEKHYAYSIILITDGGESCGGDICDVVKTLIKKKVYFKPYIVSLVDYAPLRVEYACLGSYMQVTNENDIPKTVATLVDSFHPMLTLTKTDYNQIAATLANPPSVLQVKIPTVVVPPVKEPVKKEEPKPVVTQPKQEPSKPVVIPPKQEPSKPIVEQPVTKPKADTVKHLIKTGEIQPDLPKAKDDIKRIAHNRKINTLPVAYLIETVAPLQIPNFPDPKVAPGSAVAPGSSPVTSATATTPSVKEPGTKPGTTKPGKPEKPVKPGKPQPEPKKPTKELTYTSQNIDASETTLEIYFTDSKKEKFYYTTPMLSLVDANTGKVVKKFHRTIDAAGNPDPQKDIPPGTYNLLIEGKNGEMLHADNFKIDPKMRNAIYVRVSTGTLHFQYETNPDKPVEEFTAVVFQRLEAGGKQIRQKCSMNLDYEPGNYYGEINTLPVTKFNTDVEFGSQSVIYVPEPGYVQFTNTNNVGKISLYMPLGDKYVRFYGFDINGVPASQKLKMKPGTYQVHFLKDPNMKFSGEAVLSFTVKSNLTTDLELK